MSAHASTMSSMAIRVAIRLWWASLRASSVIPTARCEVMTQAFHSVGQSRNRPQQPHTPGCKRLCGTYSAEVTNDTRSATESTTLLGW